jgi:hypothetical protein
MRVPATTHPGRGAWLVLAYRLPAGHGLKTAVRRRLTAIGAVFPNAAREQEYAEIIAGCDRIIAGIEALAAAGQFRYPDLGDKDAELKRLSMRTETIRARDTLGAANAESALATLARCRAALDDFAARVYQTDTASITGVIPGPRPPGAPK